MANLDRTKQTNETDRLISMLETRLSKIENVKTSKKYKALMSQTSTNSPTANVLENGIGDISWEYYQAGKYYAKSNGLFTDKTYIPRQMINYVDSDGDVFTLSKVDSNTLLLETQKVSGTSLIHADDLMTNFQLEFEVY